MEKISSLNDALKWGINSLNEFNIKDADLSAEILLCEVCGLNRIRLFSRLDNQISLPQKEKYFDFIQRRIFNEPLQYIIGYCYFRNLKINVGPGVLIPRPETEYLVELALSKTKSQSPKVLDLCTGSGCIACSIASELKDSKVFAVEESKDACDWAKKNINNLHFNNRIKLIKDNVFDKNNYGENFDLVISNPPYVPNCIVDSLDCQVKDYEPLSALKAGDKGLDFVGTIADISKYSLSNEGILALELFEESIDDAADILKLKGFNELEIIEDLAKKPRYIFAS